MAQTTIQKWLKSILDLDLVRKLRLLRGLKRFSMNMGKQQEGVPIVAIDSDGVFKYILIKVTTDKGVFNIVRG